MNKLARIAALAAVLSLLSGCSWEIGYHKTAEETKVEPGTGNFIRTTHWRYDDGYEITTTDTLSGNAGNVDRRTEPPQRFNHFDLF